MLADVTFFRALLHNRESTPPAFPSKEAAQKRQGAVRFLLGANFVFLLGALLIAVGVTLIFFRHVQHFLLLGTSPAVVPVRIF